MIECCEFAVTPLRRPLSTRSPPGLSNCQMVDADNVMISAIRLVRPSSCSSSFGKAGYSVAVERAATLEMEDRMMHTGSQQMGQDDQVIYLAHC